MSDSDETADGSTASVEQGPRNRGTASDGTVESQGSGADYVAYDCGPDRQALSDRYGIEIWEGQARTLQRLDAEFGSDRVRGWVEEGMPVATMGKPRDVRAFRERQADRPKPVPTDVERRNEASRRRSTQRARDDGPAGDGGVPDIVRTVISSPGRSLNGDVQRDMAAKLGGDFGDVRIHTGPRAAAAADAIDARAFTVGNHVAFNRGEYDPDTDEGYRVLAHELTHVRQQTEGAMHTLSRTDAAAIDPDSRLEREAEENARAVASTRRTRRWREIETPVQPIRRQPADSGTGGSGGDASRGSPDVPASSAREAVLAVLRREGLEPPAGGRLAEYVTVDTTYSDRSDGRTTVVRVYLGPGNQPVPKYESEGAEMAKKRVEMGPGTTVMDVVAAEGERVPASKRLDFEIYQYPDGTHDVTTRVVDARSAVIRKQAYAEGTRRGGPDLESVVGAGFGTVGVDIGQPISERRPSDPSGPSGAAETDGSPEEVDDSEGPPADDAQQPEGTPQGSGEREPGDGSAEAGRTREHEVERGETLWDLAERYYGDGTKWPVLYRANLDRLEALGPNEGRDEPDPDLIEPGMKLRVPPAARATAFDRSQYTPPASYGVGKGPL